MPRWMPLLAMTAALAAGGCADDTDVVGLTEPEACRAVREGLDAKELEGRFGKPDSTQDFFGDKVLVYQLAETKWQFQLTEQGGTFRALRVKGSREEILDCPS